MRAIGFQYLLDQLDTDLAKLKSLSLREQTAVRVVQDGGKRYLEFVFQTPGEPGFYANTTRLQLDLRVLSCGWSRARTAMARFSNAPFSSR